MKIDPNDESTLPPLGECVVLRTNRGVLLGAREYSGEGKNEWCWAMQWESPHWCDKTRTWQSNAFHDDFQVTEWWPIGGPSDDQ